MCGGLSCILTRPPDIRDEARSRVKVCALCCAGCVIPVQALLISLRGIFHVRCRKCHKGPWISFCYYERLNKSSVLMKGGATKRTVPSQELLCSMGISNFGEVTPTLKPSITQY